MCNAALRKDDERNLTGDGSGLIRRFHKRLFFHKVSSRVELFIYSLDALQSAAVGNDAQLEKVRNASHAAEEEGVSFIEADGKFKQTHRDVFSNVWEYLHCLNCELYF